MGNKLHELWDSAISNSSLFSLASETYAISWSLLEKRELLCENAIAFRNEIKHGCETKEWYSEALTLLSELENSKLRLPPDFYPETRSPALAKFASMAITLDKGAKRGNQGNGCLLLGPNGTGKTTFLHCFAIASAFLTENTTIIHLNCASQTPLPSELLFQAHLYDQGGNIPENLNLDQSSLQMVMSVLSHSERRFILIFDEFHCVYKISGNQEFITQLQVLGNHSDGRYAVFLSSGDSTLYNLCFAHLSYGLAHSLGYSSYNCMSLNDSRYSSTSISPISSLAELKALTDHILRSEVTPLSFFSDREVAKLHSIRDVPEQLAMLFVVTGGKLRSIQCFLNDPSEYVRHEIEKFLSYSDDPQYAAVLNALMEKYDQCYQMNPRADSTWISVWLSGNEVNNWSLVYTFANSGLLRIDASLQFPKVTFASKLHELIWRKKTSKFDKLSPFDHICLGYPYGQLGIDNKNI